MNDTARQPTKQCFFIAPIGEPGSAERDRSDDILDYLVRPVCTPLGYVVDRADQIAEPGLITPKIIKRLVESDLVVADLTGHNPNVFYELAIRHFLGKPVVQLIDKAARIPFDVSDLSTIRVDHRSLQSVDRAKVELSKHVTKSQGMSTIDNPIVAALRTARIAVESPGSALAQLTEQFDATLSRLIAETQRLRSERASLFSALRRQSEQVRSKVGAVDASAILTGVWHTPDGLVRIAQEGNELFGEYQHGSDEWVGDLVGRVIEQGRVIYQWSWKDGSIKGVGFWRIHDERLEGPYWYDSECCSYEEALLKPERLFRSDSSEQSEFNLSRFIEPPSSDKACVNLLSARETEVLKLVCEGLVNKQIAGRLQTSEKIVKVHRARIMAKLGVQSTAELVRAALQAGLVSMPE